MIPSVMWKPVANAPLRPTAANPVNPSPQAPRFAAGKKEPGEVTVVEGGKFLTDLFTLVHQGETEDAVALLAEKRHIMHAMENAPNKGLHPLALATDPGGPFSPRLLRFLLTHADPSTVTPELLYRSVELLTTGLQRQLSTAIASQGISKPPEIRAMMRMAHQCQQCIGVLTEALGKKLTTP